MSHARRIDTLLHHVASGSGGEGVAPEPAACFGLPPSAGIAVKDEYDFVVVGGGSAGCVVASRLSEDPEVSVLLIEAGGEDDACLVNLPSVHPFLQLTHRDWQFKSVPQRYMRGRVSNWPRGKLLGGCSSINAMIYVRGAPAAYDEWAREGCEGWSFAELLPFFKKSERAVLDKPMAGYHGTEGPLKVTDARLRGCHEYATMFVQSAARAGIPVNDDYNGASQFGVREGHFTIGEDCARSNTARAFLTETGARRRPNLTVLTCAHVTRVLFQGNTAIGVAYKRGSADLAALRKDGKPEAIVRARREVVLCAGAVATPWLLMLSGVGPAEELAAKGIPVVADLPVGRNLQDHLLVMQLHAADTFPTIVRKPRLHVVKAIAQYLFTGRGPASHSMLQATAFWMSGLRKDDRADETGVPDFQIHFAPGLPDDEMVLAAFNLKGAGSHYRTGLGHYGMILCATLLQPESRGTITLNSADPFDYPVIEPNYLATEYDVEVLVRGLKKTREIARQPPLAEHITQEVVDETIPFDPASDEYLREYVRRGASTVYHPVGTCRMGALVDPRTVVDPRLRVKGVNRLRVVDASIIPLIPSANTNAPVIMVGEKGADLIRQDWAAPRAPACK